MHLLLVPVHLHLGGEPVTAFLVLADERMVLPVGLLLLLPLHWMLLGLVLVHLPWIDAAHQVLSWSSHSWHSQLHSLVWTRLMCILTRPL